MSCDHCSCHNMDGDLCCICMDVEKFKGRTKEEQEKIESDHVDATLRDHGIDPIALVKQGEAFAKICLANEELKIEIKKSGHTDRANAYRKIAESCRKQIGNIESSGWGKEERRCAIINMEALALLCDVLADNEDLGINTIHDENCDVNDNWIKGKPCNCRGRR